MQFRLRSNAFVSGGSIPPRYTCEGEDLSPPLSWSGLPPGTRSLALVVEDPDAPDPAAPEMTYVHWLVYNIPPEVEGFEEGLVAERLPGAARLGTNDWQRPAYGGPCPPVGRHRYVHRLLALDAVLPELNHPTIEVLEQAMEGHVLGSAELIGTYQKQH